MAPLTMAGKAPGVYIDEIAVPGPIPGVSTNIAAFAGPATTGPLFTPTFLTSFKQFTALFGSYIEDPYRVYATHAVEGFFNEGGTQCWFVRVGTGKAAWLNLVDQNATPRNVLRVTALQEGKPAAGKDITVQVDAAHAGSAKAVHAKPAGALTGAAANQNIVTTGAEADAAKFKPTDLVLLEKGAGSERAQISSIASDAGAHTSTFTLAGALSADYTGGTMRLADLAVGQTVIRVESIVGFETGTCVTIAQNAVTEDAIVRQVDTTNNFVTLTKGVANIYTLKDGDPDVTLQTQEFKLTVVRPGSPTEVFDKLAMDPRHSRYFLDAVQSALVSVDFSDPPSTTLPAKNVPKTIAATPLAGGADEDRNALTSVQYVQGIDALKRTTSVNLLAVPDAVGSKMQKADTQAIQTALVNHCQKLQDRFGILDPRPVTDPNNFNPDITQQRSNLDSDNGYAALYFPWIKIASPFDSTQILVPPSGHVAGVYANNDNTRGVFKAPANEPITMALDVELPLSDDDQGVLNDVGINGIRQFPNQGIRIWGARTITPPDSTQWRYVNVRRLLIFIEKSIQEGTRFAVFEPNNVGLWGKLKRVVDDFLTGIWAAGALEGATPDKSFRVRIDESLNPSASIALGILTAEITIFPAPPAEFVIFQIIQEPGGSFVNEQG
jgi:Bacteriophage tail sheath protein